MLRRLLPMDVAPPAPSHLQIPSAGLDMRHGWKMTEFSDQLLTCSFHGD